MNISSLHLKERHPFVTLIGKGRKSRNVPLLNKTVQHLNEYLKEFHLEMNEQPLFYSLLDGKPHRLSIESREIRSPKVKKIANYSLYSIKRGSQQSTFFIALYWLHFFRYD